MKPSAITCRIFPALFIGVCATKKVQRITRIEESGELPEESDRRVKQSETILAMVENGATNAEIMRECPSAMLHLQRIEQARQTLLEETYRKEFRKLKVEYIWGETGVGKRARSWNCTAMKTSSA